MKRTKFCLLSFSLVALLASCNGSSTSSPYRIQVKDSVITEELAKANARENKAYSVKKSVSLKDTSLAPMGDDLVLVSKNYERGYAIYAKDQGDPEKERHGIYSLFGNTYLIEPRLKQYEYQFYSDRNAGFKLKYKDVNDRYYLVDGYGNRLYESKYNFTLEQYDLYHDINGALYSPIEIREGGVDTILIFKYDENFKATKVDDMPVEEEYADIYKSYNVGDSIVEKVDLKDFGLDRYYVENEEEYQYVDIYNSVDNSFINRIEIPSTAKGHYFVVGGSLFYQTMVDVTKDGTSYNYAATMIDTYFVESAKYMIRTYKASLKDGSVKEIETQAIIQDVDLVKDENGINRYAAVTLTELNEEKAAGAERTLIMDENGKFRDDITNKKVFNYLRLSNGNYYNEIHNTLYDKNFNILSTKNNRTLGWEFNQEKEVIITDIHNGSTSTSYVLNNEGNVVIALRDYGNNHHFLANDVIAIQTNDLRYHYFNVTDGSAVSVNELYFKTTEESTPITDNALEGVLVREEIGEDDDHTPFTNYKLFIPGGNELSILCYDRASHEKLKREYDDAQFELLTVVNKDLSVTEHLISTGGFTVTPVPAPNVEA